jgi:hypothetical protein
MFGVNVIFVIDIIVGVGQFNSSNLIT